VDRAHCLGPGRPRSFRGAFPLGARASAHVCACAAAHGDVSGSLLRSLGVPSCSGESGLCAHYAGVLMGDAPPACCLRGLRHRASPDRSLRVLQGSGVGPHHAAKRAMLFWTGEDDAKWANM
jgi:hypothetical protein